MKSIGESSSKCQIMSMGQNRITTYKDIMYGIIDVITRLWQLGWGM